MHIRICVPVAMRGHIQMLRGDTFPVEKAFGDDLIAKKEAVEVPHTEHAVMPRPVATTVSRPQPAARPKPETRRKGRR